MTPLFSVRFDAVGVVLALIVKPVASVAVADGPAAVRPRFLAADMVVYGRWWPLAWARLFRGRVSRCGVTSATNGDQC